MEALKPRLRVGVFAGAAPQPRWMVEALARAAASPWAEIASVTLLEAAPQAVPALWRAYSRLDSRLFGSAANWSERRDVTQLVGRDKRVRDAAWRAQARDARLDVAFAVGEVDDALLDGVARFGTWRFCFGEEHGTREALAGMREALERNPVLASGLRIRLGAGEPDRLACPSWGRAFPFSVARSRDAAFAKASEFLARALRELQAGGTRWIEEGTWPAAQRREERFPGTLGLARDIATLGTRVAQRAAEKALTVEQWSIAYRFAGAEAWDGSLEGFHRLDPPKGWYWADPFPIQVNGRNYIFFEELPLGASKAHISVVEVDREGRASAPRKVLERDYHLSYPFLVEEDGVLYMIPETADNATVEVYRCVEFPAQWTLERVLMRQVRCADATLHREAGRWWMFANSARPGEDINDELCLFSAERLLGDWEPHRRNPVKSDVRSARPAGRLFRRGGRLYRPGQIGTPLYGSGIALHRVTRLDRDGYEEQEESRIVPPPAAAPRWAGIGSVLGVHTLNHAGDLTVTDAFTRRARF